MQDVKTQCHHFLKEWKTLNRTRDVLGDIRSFLAEKFEELRKGGLENELANKMEQELGDLLARQRRILEDRRSKLEDQLAEGGCPRGS